MFQFWYTDFTASVNGIDNLLTNMLPCKITLTVIMIGLHTYHYAFCSNYKIHLQDFSISTSCNRYFVTPHSVADLGFPRGGGQSLWGRCRQRILPKFPKNFMKLKEFGPEGTGRPQFYYVAPPLTLTNHRSNFC